MKEREIIAKVKTELDKRGAWYWVAHKSPFYPQSDIFGIFDIVYIETNGTKIIRRGDIGFIQATTKSHLSHRRNKIKAAFERKGIPVPPRVYVWAFDSKASRFIKEAIT